LYLSEFYLSTREEVSLNVYETQDGHSKWWPNKDFLCRIWEYNERQTQLQRLLDYRYELVSNDMDMPVDKKWGHPILRETYSAFIFN